MKSFLFAVAFSVFLVGSASAATYYISTNGNDTTGNGSYGNPWATTTKAFQNMVGNDWMMWKYGYYTSTGNGAGACVSIDNNTFPAHTSATIVLSGELPQGTMNSTSSVVLSGCGTGFDLFLTSYIAVQDLYVRDTGKAVQLFDCPNSKISFKRIGFKEPAPYVGQYSQGLDFGDDNNSPYRATSDVLLEDIWVDGDFRYGIIWGGSTGYTEHMIARRVVIRASGNSGVNPKAGFANYGVTGTIDGARNNILQNCIALDFNNSSFFTGESVYGAFYNPWGPTNIQIKDSIAMYLGNGWPGFALGENNSANNAIYNSVAFRVGAEGIRLTGATQSSITVAGCTVLYATSATQGQGIYGDGVIGARNSLIERNALTAGSMSSDNYNAYESTANPTGSTNEVLGVHQVLHITSVTDSALIGAGLNGENIGAVILWKRGQDGTFWGESGYDTLTSNSLWPFPYEDRIKSVLQYVDDGDNTGSTVNRGLAASNLTLSSYVWSAAGTPCPANICTQAAVESCTSTTLSPSVFAGASSSFSVTYTSAAASSYVVVMSSNSDFSAPRSSGSTLANTTSYANLTQGVTYYFEVKIATEADCAYSVSISTCWIPLGGGGGGGSPPPEGPPSNRTLDVHGNGFIRFGPGYIKTQ